jgi:hypothetical protein
MKKYRRIKEVFIIQWVGDESILKDIQNVLNEINAEYGDEYFIVSIDDKTLCLLYGLYKYGGVTSSFLEIGEYVVLDLDNENHPFFGLNETNLNKTYIEIV